MTTEHADLAERVRHLEDRSQLWELVARYANAVDDEDYATLERCFAKDAEFVGLSGNVTAGRDGVVAYLAERARAAHETRVHTPTSQVLTELGDDRAAGVVGCYAALFSRNEGDRFFAFRYEDHYTREDGRWMFRSRRVHQVVDLPR